VVHRVGDGGRHTHDPDLAEALVAVSSSGHLSSPVVFDDLHFAFRPYDPLLAYGQSKTANVLFAVGATARWAGDGITANALNPGAVETNLQRYVNGWPATPPERRKTTRQGAATTVLLATSPLLDGIGGRYFNDCNEGVVVDHRPSDSAKIFRSVAPTLSIPTTPSASGKRRSASSPDSTIYKPARCGRLRPGGDVIGNLAGSSVRSMARHP